MSGGSKTRSGYFGDLGGPGGGRDRRTGSFLMRCAGLVTCTNRKNRQPTPGLGTDRGRGTARPAQERALSAGRASVARTERHRLGGTRDTRLVRTTVEAAEPAGARQSGEWCGIARRYRGTEREARTTSAGVCGDGKTEQRNEQGVGEIVALLLDARRLGSQHGLWPTGVVQPRAGRQESRRELSLDQKGSAARERPCGSMEQAG
jgi:hypothetical protein